MAVNEKAYRELSEELRTKNISLVAVSKTKPVEDILALYNLGHRDFGENYVQELVEKQSQLPGDIRWHFIGHLQTNKVKQIAPFVHLIHGADSMKLLQEINKQAAKNNRTINCLLQIHIAQEETKFGMNEEELSETIRQFDNSKMRNINISGLMGMASFTDNMEKVREEFKYLKSLFDETVLNVKLQTSNLKHQKFTILSMGMSADYKVAIEEGSTMVRIGSLLFGAR